MTFYVGVDLHKTQFTVHVRTEEMIETQDQIKIYPTTESGYAEFLKRIRIYRQTGAVVKLAVESTGNTKFFKNQAEKAGALGQPRGMGCGERWEGGSGWGDTCAPVADSC